MQSVRQITTKIHFRLWCSYFFITSIWNRGYKPRLSGGTFLHEAIHAEMKRQLNDLSLNEESFDKIWDAWDDQINHHENMANSYINEIVSALALRFGDRYTQNEYEAIAWHGLGNVNGEGVNTSAWNNLSEERKNELTETFNDINNNCDEDNCKE